VNQSRSERSLEVYYQISLIGFIERVNVKFIELKWRHGNLAADPEIPRRIIDIKRSPIIA
jgi:hypothetical protein